MINNDQVCLKNIIEIVPYFIFWKDINSIYLGCNQKFANLVGKKSPEDIIGKSDSDLGWREGEPELFRMHDQKIMNGIPIVNIEGHLLKPDGSITTMLVHKLPLLNKKGECIGLLGTSPDITERKPLEEVDRLKNEFLSNMSHDVKTPLTGLIDLTNLLINRIQDPELSNTAKNILDCGKSLFHFFDNYHLESSQLDNVNCSTTTDFFNLRELADEVLALFMPAAKAKNLALELEYDTRISEQLLGSRSTIYRIMQNLIGNAIKFTHEGGINIKIALGEKSTAHEMVVAITVQDSGIGISKDKQKIIFERLTRLTPYHEEINTGAGIGLHLVQKFTHALSGQVYVESEETKGSRFTVVLPLQIPLLTSQEYKEMLKPSEALKITLKPLEETVPKPAEKQKTSRPPLKILLVEDNKIALRVAQTIIEGMQHHADSAANGTDGIALFTANKYDLVLVDIGLPDFDGYELTEKLREIERDKNLDLTPIVALTAHDAKNISNKANASGINAILSKPLSEEKMRDIVENFVYIELSKTPTPSFRGHFPDTETNNYFARKTVDLEEGAKILGENHTLAKKMLMEFMESLPETRADIENAFRSKNLTVLFDIIHRFYGGLCYVGTPYLRQAAKELENALLKKEEYQVNRLYQRLLDEISSLEKDSLQ